MGFVRYLGTVEACGFDEREQARDRPPRCRPSAKRCSPNVLREEKESPSSCSDLLLKLVTVGTYDHLPPWRKRLRL
jgi:hypothetical protein